MMRSLFTVASICFVMIQLVTAASHDSKRLWPLPTDFLSDEESIKNPQCEVCQVVAEVIAKQMNSKKAAGLTKKGLTDVTAMEVMKADKLCTFGNFISYAEFSDMLPVYKMTGICGDIIGESEELLEAIVPKHFESAVEIANGLCIPKYCEKLWDEKEKPENRESKREKNLRLATEFLAWNEQQSFSYPRIDGWALAKRYLFNSAGMLPSDVTVLPSGLQYRVISKGKNKNGKSPKAEDTVSVHYSGRTLNGKEFDSSYSRGKPTEFPLNAVIAGWTEGIQLMEPGDSFQFFIPSKLGYGEMGAGNVIGPNECLVFDVELLKVVSSKYGEL